MSQLHSPYVPPDKSQDSEKASSKASAEKRKHSEVEQEIIDGSDHNKKARKDGQIHSRAGTEDQKATEKQLSGHASGTSSGLDVLNKYRVSQFVQGPNNQTNGSSSRRVEYRKKRADLPLKSQGIAADAAESNEHEDPASEDHRAKDNNKHLSLLRKYDKSKRRSICSEQTNEIGDNPSLGNATTKEHDLRDLVPIPQPGNIGAEPKEPEYITVSAWQAAATKVKLHNRVPFKALGLSDKALCNLKSQNISEAFPIQSTVIPLLMGSYLSYRGDLCVSAATGSGKTLAYVIPVIESLRKSEKSGLRAVFVVPTRELVKQVREICEMCATGSNLSIVTALGSKSLQDEQKALVVEEEIHDPEGYKEELSTPIDWTICNLEKIIKTASRRDFSKLENFVLRSRVKADILITTPGRLVDHLQETDGFHLDDVEWLVVDEADRLLNESYQDWIDVVVPALQSRTATEKRDRIFGYLRMDLPPRIVRKVLLSATMTQDISKLNHIGLVRPKLVVLEPQVEESIERVDAASELDVADAGSGKAGKFALPLSLQEYAVTFKEGADKPLLLLQLLKTHLHISETPRVATESEMASNTSETSSDDSTDDSDTSSDAISSSDSDTDSDESSSSSSDSETDQVKSNISQKRRVGTTETSTSSSRALIFTRSTASASRLSRLLALLEPSLATQIGTLTRSTTSSSSSRKALCSFRNGKTSILVATDRASRGIDVPGLEHVISYDIPGSAMSHVHRVGRTARAGMAGNAWTLVEHREGRWFWNELGGKSNNCAITRSSRIKKIEIPIEDDNMRKRYENALKVLGSEVRGD